MQCLRYIGLCLIGMLLIMGPIGCDDEQKDVDFKYDYFPTEVGHWVTYKVDSIVIDNQSGKFDTAHYFLKDEIASQFKDEEGRPSYRIIRYKRRSKSDSWKVQHVYYATRTSVRLEVQENNLRYIKLVFPPEKNDSWKGHNLLNPENINKATYCDLDFEDWEFSYEKVDQSTKIGDLKFDSTLTVHQKVSGNLVDTVNYVEKYAKGVGLIYQQRYHKNDDNAKANWPNPSCADITVMRVIDYSS